MISTGYYRALADDDPLKAGDVVYVTKADERRVHFSCGAADYCAEAADFAANYEPAPDGLQVRQRQINALMAQIATMDIDPDRLSAGLGNLLPHVTGDGAVTGTELVPSQGTPVAAKQAIATVRNNVLRFRSEMQCKQDQLRGFLEEQKTAMLAKAKELDAIVKKAEEAIWSINLYLGKDEEIVQIATGDPAPAETKITIRQLVLFMDEECALAADEGGIDFRNVQEFDDWVVRPDNLQQVLPEPKGVVALKVRRDAKRYGDCPWTNAAFNERNRVTYFLLRNGGNVYRLYTEFDVGTTLFPTRSEFGGYFVERHYDRKSGDWVEEPMTPGSDAYMKAMEQADADRRHYLRTVLILQGLLDRTKVFQPLPAPHINICNPREYDRYLHFVHDAEGLLGDNRPSFWDWLAGVNASLTVGQRVIGAFNTYTSRENFKTAERVYPAAAGTPKENVLFTIDDKDGKAFVFHFDRGEIWSRDKGYHKSTVRARCLIYPDDPFVLNFDAADVSDMEHYLASRLERHNYQYMFPLLRRAIALKQQEEQTETPFYQLLAGQIAKEYGVSVERASTAVPGLVRWWKFKNRTHRALTSRDDLALRMIVQEFGVRQRRELERLDRAAAAEPIVAHIRRTEPACVLVAHKAKNEYVALVAHNDDNVYVKEQIWKHNRQTGALRLDEDKHWRPVDKRFERWLILWHGDRWPHWQIDPLLQEHLTDPERDELIRQTLAWPGHRRYRARHDEDGDELAMTPQHLALGIVETIDAGIVFYYCDCLPELPTEHLLSNMRGSSGDYLPSLSRVQVSWERKPAGLVAKFGDHYTICYNLDNPPWAATYEGRVGYYEKPRRVLWASDANEHQLRQWAARAKDVLRQRAALDRAARHIDRDFERTIRDKKEAAAFQDYLAEFGAPDLWEEHKKKLHLGFNSSGVFSGAIRYLVERGFDPAGNTGLDAVKLAMSLGYDPAKHTPGHDRREPGPDNNYCLYAEELTEIVPPGPPPASGPDEDDD